MKTIDNFKQYHSVVIFSILLVASTVGANAQNYRSEGKKGKNHEHKEYREPERKEYRESDKDDDRVVYIDRKGDYEKRNWNDREYRPKYNNRHKHYDADYFEHPKYGRVYQRFDRSPIVFHHDRNDYYYYGDHFYTYRRGTGYCVVEPPRNVYFRTLPVECERVYVDGHLLFRHGDLFFQLSPRGYVMATSPVGIHISAHF